MSIDKVIGIDAEKFKLPKLEDAMAIEKLMVEKVFPFVSSNALTIALIALYDFKVVPVFWLIATCGGSLLAIAVWRLRHFSDGPFYTILAGTFTVLALLVIYMTASYWTYAIGCALLSTFFIYGVLQKIIPQGAMWFYMFYLSVLSGIKFEEDLTPVIAFCFLHVLAVFISFYALKLIQAATAAITATMIYGMIEVVDREEYGSGLISLFVLAFIAAIIFEFRRPVSITSDFKMYLRQSILVLIVLLLVVVVHFALDSGIPISISWFTVVLIYQGIKIYQSKDNNAARMSWIMTTLLVMLLSQIEKGNALIISSFVSIAGLGSTIIARRYNSRFLFNLSLCFLLYSLFLSVEQSEIAASPAIILLAVLNWVCLVQFTTIKIIRDDETNRWWAGFIQERDIQTLKHYGEEIVDKIFKIPVIGGFASLIATLVKALRNIKGADNPLGYLDVLFILSHFLVIEAITGQVRKIGIFGPLAPWQLHSLELFVYIFFGLVLFIIGAMSYNLFLRLVGIVIFLFPLGSQNMDDKNFNASTAYLYGITGLITGGVYLLYVANKKVIIEADAALASELKVKE